MTHGSRPMSGASPDVLLARLAAKEWGVLAVSEIRDCGMSYDAVRTRLRNGRLHPIHRGVYAVGHAHLTLQGRFLAAVKACGSDAVLSHFSAAALLGIVQWDGRYPEVTVAGGSERRHRGLCVHRTRILEPEDRGRHQGVPVTTPERTLVDLAAILDRRSLRRAVRQAQGLRLVTCSGVLGTLRRLGPRRGARKLAEALTTGPAPTRSELEDVVLDLMLGGGLSCPDVNVPLLLSGRTVVPDFRWPEQRLIVEADGARWHEGRLAREHDAERQAVLEAHGERVLRVTWDQAVRRPEETLSRIRAAGAPESTPPRPSPRRVLSNSS